MKKQREFPARFHKNGHEGGVRIISLRAEEGAGPSPPVPSPSESDHRAASLGLGEFGAEIKLNKPR